MDMISHRSWRDHHLIGFGQKNANPLKPGPGVHTKHEAFVWLTGEPYASRDFNGRNGNVLTLGLIDGHWIPNLSAEWNWRPSDVGKFFNDLVAEGLVTEELAAAVLAKLPRRTSERRQALPRATRQAVWAKTSGKCVYCAVVLTNKKDQPNSFHVDHGLAKSQGGSDDIANLIPSCRTCNIKKKAGTLVAFAGVGRG